MQYAGITHRGRVRATNQDRWHVDPEKRLLLIADGMGGQAAGELAAQIVCESLPRRLARQWDMLSEQPPGAALDELARITAALSNDTYRESLQQPAIEGLGSTVVLVVQYRRRLLFVSMGDSRAYLLRGGRLRQLTTDHSVAEYLAAAGKITRDELPRHPGAHRLTRFLGMPAPATPATGCLPVEPRDRVLLCTDGLTNMVDESRLQELLDAGASPAETSRQLVEAALDAGGKDNVTVVIADMCCGTTTTAQSSDLG